MLKCSCPHRSLCFAHITNGLSWCPHSPMIDQVSKHMNSWGSCSFKPTLTLFMYLLIIFLSSLTKYLFKTSAIFTNTNYTYCWGSVWYFDAHMHTWIDLWNLAGHNGKLGDPFMTLSFFFSDLQYLVRTSLPHYSVTLFKQFLHMCMDIF